MKKITVFLSIFLMIGLVGSPAVAIIINPHSEEMCASYCGRAGVVDIYLHTVDSSINAYYKYGPTPDDITDHWYKFPNNEFIHAYIVHRGGVSTIDLSFVDGQTGDGDLKADGVISDPGAPTVEPGSGSDGGGGCFFNALD